MKMLLFAITLLTSLTISDAARKTLVKTIPAKTVSSIEIDVERAIEIVPVRGNNIRVFVEIVLTGRSENILKHLIMAKRYHLNVATLSEGKLRVTMPNIVKKIVINNQVLKEEVSIKVFVPEGIDVNGLNLVPIVIKK